MGLRTAICCLLFAFGATGVSAQKKNLASLEQSAQKAHAEWRRLASNLEVRVARMLPCSPGAITAIQNVERAARVRVIALTEYAEAAAEQAADEKRQSALRRQVGELFEERGKWNAYYNARLARARLECSATGAGR